MSARSAPESETSCRAAHHINKEEETKEGPGGEIETRHEVYDDWIQRKWQIGRCKKSD